MAVSEMMSANPETWGTDKSLKRMYLADEPGIRAVQIVGSEPDWMADAARRWVAMALSGIILVGNVSFPIMILAGVVH